MKTRILVFAVALSFFAASCGKKEKKESDSKDKVKTPATKTDAKGKKVDDKKVDDKKVVRGLPKTNDVKPVEVKKPVDAGKIEFAKLPDLEFKPLFAAEINIAKMVKSPLFNDLTDNGNDIKMDLGDDFKKTAECAGLKVAKPYEIMDKVHVFGLTKEDLAVLLGFNVEVKKFVECAVKNGKDIKKVKFQGKDAYEFKNKKTGEKGTLIETGKNSVLVLIGKAGDKVKVGAGKIGTGNVADYFSAIKTPGCIKVVVRDMPIPADEKITALMPKLKTISLDFAAGSNDKNMMASAIIDVKDADAAKGAVGFANLFLNGPQAKAELTKMGIDAGILKNLVLQDSGSFIKASVNLEIAVVKTIVAKLKGSKNAKKAPVDAPKVDKKPAKTGKVAPKKGK
ncbi:hypothetical protein KKF34_10265 [Myxococcota bacterium]|nr:hypothetical protein [Myxococcota bacterium]MBU1382659.1 hypothetical protein [Myxococcota bacterium]MBU1497249.1 hypothetical protein [Myxococcota bacterium]